MRYPFWDTTTFVFYYIIAILCVVLIGMQCGSVTIGKHNTSLDISGTYFYNKFNGYSLLIWLLILFAVLRKVGPGIGGTDAMSYEEDFINSLKDLNKFNSSDILFGYYIYTLRTLTSSVFIFQLTSYSFIAYCICYTIREMCPRNSSSIPFILIIWLYLCGFNTMRSTMAIGLCMLSLTALMKNKISLTWVLFLLSCLMHRMMLVLFPMYLLFKPVSKLINKCNKIQFCLLMTLTIIVTVLMAYQVQKFVILFGILDNADSPDAGYISNTLDSNILESWPMFIQQFLLLIFLIVNYKHFDTTKERFVLVISCFDIVITLPALILGIWRISQCLLIPTLILWGVLIYNFNHKFTSSIRPLINFIFLIGFSFFFYTRINAIYESSSLMPYLFIWQ